jgi:uncharacterized protein (TIGR02145 family)
LASGLAIFPLLCGSDGDTTSRQSIKDREITKDASTQVSQAELKKVDTITINPKDLPEPTRSRTKVGDMKVWILDFGSILWMAEDLNYSVLNSRLYYNGRSENRYIRLYTQADCMRACNMLGWRCPFNRDWTQLLASYAGNDNSMRTEGGYDHVRAYGVLTTKEPGFRATLNGFGYTTLNNSILFDGKDWHANYWTASFLNENPGLKIFYRIDRKEGSVNRMITSPADEFYMSCRCVKDKILKK